jgi:AcrR family transcriptional regulator
MRADAVRNRERLLAAALEVFTEHGADASLDEIAKRAGVGPGTLYRHFPTRQALQEAAYREGVEDLCAKGYELAATLEPGPALGEWLRLFVGYLGQKRGLSAALLATQDKMSELFVSCHKAIYAAGEQLLGAAKQSGAVREDLTLAEILKLINGIGLATEQLPELRTETAERLLSIVLDGFRPPPESRES